MRRWHEDQSTVLYIGHNPSMATATKDDPTIRAMRHFAKGSGAGRFVVVNLYPFRSSDPAACRLWAACAENRRFMDQNYTEIRRQARFADTVVACWGALAQDRAAVDEAVCNVWSARDDRRVIYCLGVTASGAPKHPLARGRNRIPREQQFVPWGFRQAV
ncbi:MAG: DUF1643 domain-containing protein [Dongiaceae bacterium]